MTIELCQINLFDVGFHTPNSSPVDDVVSTQITLTRKKLKDKAIE